MAQGSYQLGGDEVKQESSWRYPLIILFATLILCVIFLYHYVGPDVDEIQGNKPRPTISEELIDISVGDIDLRVPANYTVFPRDRRPGERELLTLFSSWPRMEGYAPSRRNDFIENEADARRIDLLIGLKQMPFNEEQRLDILYLPQTVDSAGSPYEHGLTRYTFKQGTPENPASGYSDREMLIGETASGETAVFFCYPESENGAVPPECFREYDLTETVSVKYYFKRPYLAEWQRIDEGVKRLVGGPAGKKIVRSAYGAVGAH
ncbi:MAG: hypothetical protein AAGA69_00255 [Pseudomonadota bacterium]